eukprot:4697596-Pyramimonas_sp.AAC.1
MAQRPGGMHAVFLKCAQMFFRARVLKVHRGAHPPDSSSAGRYRIALLQLMFSKPEASVEDLRKLGLLEKYLNGNWETEAVEHYCPPGCCPSVAATKRAFEDE